MGIGNLTYDEIIEKLSRNSITVVLKKNRCNRWTNLPVILVDNRALFATFMNNYGESDAMYISSDMLCDLDITYIYSV
jgi:hypothetical protein